MGLVRSLPMSRAALGSGFAVLGTPATALMAVNAHRCDTHGAVRMRLAMVVNL